LRRRARGHGPGRRGRARRRPWGERCAELPDDRPAQGSGGPEHLDGVGSSGLNDVEPVTADLELVAVLKWRPLDPLAVDEQAVQAAIVEGAQLVFGSADDQSMSARNGRVVELDIGRAAATDPVPAIVELDDHGLVVLLEGDAQASGREVRAHT